MCQPDGAAYFNIHGQQYVITANEGDVRPDFGHKVTEVG